MVRRKLKKEEMRKDVFRSFLGRVFSETEMSLETHWKTYLAGLLVFIVAVAAAYLYVNNMKAKEEASSLLLNEVLEIADAPVLAKDAPDRENMVRSGMKVYLTESEKSTDLKKKLGELDLKNPSGDQEKVALIVRASDLAKSGAYPEALKLLDGMGGNSAFKASALQLKARIYELQKDDAKAEAAFKELASVKAPDMPAPMGLELLAGYYDKHDRKAEALKTYEEALKILADEKKAGSGTDAKKPPQAPAAAPASPQKDETESKIRERIKELKTAV